MKCIHSRPRLALPGTVRSQMQPARIRDAGDPGDRDGPPSSDRYPRIREDRTRRLLRSWVGFHLSPAPAIVPPRGM